MVNRLSGVAVALVVMGCQTGSPSADAGPAGQVELFSWWKEPSEAGALDRVFSLFAERNPGVQIVNGAAELQGEAARDEVLRRFLAGSPPDLFLLGASGIAQGRWTSLRIDGGVPMNVLAPVDEALVGSTNVLPPSISEIIASPADGRPYIVPLGLHRQNSMVVSQRLLGQLGSSAPRSMSDFRALCASVKRRWPAGEVATLAVSRQPWMADILFKNIVIASAEESGPGRGAAYYLRLSTGRADPARDPEFRKAVRDMNEVLACATQPVDQSFGWTEATSAIRTQQVVLFIHGDWAKGELVARGSTPGADFDVTPTFGTQDLFLYNIDGFSMFRGAPNPDFARAMLSVMASPEAQRQFNAVKGSTPVRTDLDLSEMDPVFRSTYQHYRAVPHLITVERDDSCFWYCTGEALVGRFWTSRQMNRFATDASLESDVDAVIAIAATQYPNLKRFFP